MLSILSDMLDGREPDLREVALARAALLRHLDLYEPLNTGGHIRNANLDVSGLPKWQFRRRAAGALMIGKDT